MVSRKCVQNVSKNIHFTVVGARQNFQFSKQNTWFLENSKALSKFLYVVLHYLISIIKLQKKLVQKTQLYINHVSHLKKNILNSH